jgi:penicillin-binding protein 1B
MPPRRRPARRPKKSLLRRLIPGLSLVAVVVALALAGYAFYLDHNVRALFEGRRWTLPAHVYARPLELFAGLPMTAPQLEQELAVLRYRADGVGKSPGTFARAGSRVTLTTRPFTFWDGRERSHTATLRFEGARLAVVEGGNAGLLRLDPLLIGGIYPAQQEDRILVRLDEVGPFFSRALLAIEDRNFYSHHGVSPLAILRALFANLRAGATVQGGSTLTQQLVKNFYLTNARTLKRKFDEAIMALLLDRHYRKDEILEAYLNEVYLGQDGNRAIHGFGLASRFYFERPLAELQPHHVALLVALVKGPSYYDPRRHPERARARRNLVLDVLAEQGVLEVAAAQKAKAQPLDVAPGSPSGVTQHPAFLDLVRRQLKRDYHEADLTEEGLQIFTTLDPLTQHSAERALANRLKEIERGRGLRRGSLQGAAVAVSVEGGEMLALVGGRDARFTGFNRALDARRQIGSLVKPAVYLTALADPQHHTLASVLDDSPLRLRNADGSYWSPQNYDREYNQQVLLRRALARSYNVATVRLGLDVGVRAVIGTLNKLGVTAPLNPYPSLLLGADALTPIEVAQMYHTLAAGGFRTPLRAIREVLNKDGEPLARYPLKVEQTLDARAVYLVNHALQAVVREGTGQSLSNWLPDSLAIAGKTGTTDKLRDSWFAGFAGDKLAVVWVGRDDDKPAGLSGASGALQVWGELMQGAFPQPLALGTPEGIEFAWVDAETGLRSDSGCAASVQWPFIRGSAPTQDSQCAAGRRGNPIDQATEWFKGILQ